MDFSNYAQDLENVNLRNDKSFDLRCKNALKGLEIIKSDPRFETMPAENKEIYSKLEMLLKQEIITQTEIDSIVRADQIIYSLSKKA